MGTPENTISMRNEFQDKYDYQLDSMTFNGKRFMVGQQVTSLESQYTGKIYEILCNSTYVQAGVKDASFNLGPKNPYLLIILEGGEEAHPSVLEPVSSEASES